MYTTNYQIGTQNKQKLKAKTNNASVRQSNNNLNFGRNSNISLAASATRDEAMNV